MFETLLRAQHGEGYLDAWQHNDCRSHLADAFPGRVLGW